MSNIKDLADYDYPVFGPCSNSQKSGKSGEWEQLQNYQDETVGSTLRNMGICIGH